MTARAVQKAADREDPARRAATRRDPARGWTAPREWAGPLEGVLFWSLVLVLAVAPAPLASNRPLPASLLALAAGLLLALWGLAVLLGGASCRVPLWRTLPVTLPFLLVCGWAWVQAASWTSPELHHELWARAAEALRPGIATTPAISVDPLTTRAELARLLGYGAVFWLAMQLGRDERRAGQAVAALAVIGIGYAAFAIAMFLAGGEAFGGALDWMRSGPRLSATFVNPNNYATYAGIGLLAGMAMVAAAIGNAVGRRQHWRLVVVELFGSEPRLTVGLMAMVLCGAAMMLTQSRGAVIAAVVALLVLAVALAGGRGVLHAALTAVLLVAALGLVELLGDRTAERLARGDVDMARRFEMYEASLAAIRDHPWLGTGYGTFPVAMQAYKPASIAALEFDKAHNTYLQKAVELGLPAFGLLVLAVVWVFLRCAVGVVTRRRQRTVMALTLAVIVLVAGHALVDFSLEMPAVAATFAFVLGLGFAQVWSRRKLAG